MPEQARVTTIRTQTAAREPISYHAGGVLGVMCDASVRFINESIDAGNLGATEAVIGPSPYGVWGAMGSKDGAEGGQAR